MYVDDLCVVISSRYVHNLKSIIDSINAFGVVCGLKLNLSKSALVLKGHFRTDELDYFRECGLSIKDHVKYLGVLIGNISCFPGLLQNIKGGPMQSSSGCLLWPLSPGENSTPKTMGSSSPYLDCQSSQSHGTRGTLFEGSVQHGFRH